MTARTDGDPAPATTDDALHAARGLGAAIVLAGVIYIPIILGAIVAIGLHQGWW